MKKLKILGLFLVGFVVGGIAVSMWWRQAVSRMYVSKEVELAAKAAFAAEWLAELRLGDTQFATEMLPL